MSHPYGAYLGGIRTLEDLRQRCRIDELTECWHWGMAMCDGRPRVWLSGHVPGNPKASRMTGTRATFLLSRGEMPQTNRKAHLTCGTVDCVNPEHVVAWTREEHGRWIAKQGIWRNQPHRCVANRANMRKRAKLSIEKAREIRASSETQLALSARYGVSQSVICGIKHGKIWPEHVSNSSVFERRA